MATIQGIYIALFGRPADPGGLAYWNGVTNNGSDLSKLIGQLTASQEYTDRFKGQTNEQVVTSIYQSLFGRAPDATGLAFFTKGLTDGTFKLETLAINILDGAQGSDKTIIDNKTAAADLFTKSIDTAAEIAAYNGNAAAELARAFLTKVTDDKGTIPAQADVDKAVAGVVTPSGGQGPADGGGGGSTGPTGPTTLPNTYKVNDLVAANNGGKLFVGTGNSADGFAITNNPNNGVELGLSVRHRFGDVADNGIADSSTKVVKFYDQNIDQLAFAYSVAKTGGLNVAGNTYKLIVDTDPTAASASKAQFILAADATTTSGFKWVYDLNNNGVIDSGETIGITDDGKSTDGSAIQNIQPLQWLLNTAGNAGKQGIYDVKLVSTDAAGNSTESAIQIHATKADSLGAVSKADTGYMWAGRGNSAEKFATVELAEGLELGLSGRIKFAADPISGAINNTDKLVHYSANSGDNVRFAYSIESTTDKTLADYSFKLKIDVDPSAGTQYVVYELNGTDAVSTSNTGNSSYSWSTTDGFGAIADDGGDGAIGKVTQNIQNIAWYDADTSSSTLQAGQYDVILEAYQGTTLIGTNHVVFDITNPLVVT